MSQDTRKRPAPARPQGKNNNRPPSKSSSPIRPDDKRAVVKRPADKRAVDKRPPSKRPTEKKSVPKSQPKKKETIRKPYKNYSTGIVAGIFFIVVISYLVVYVMNFFNKTSVPMIEVESGSIEAPVEMDAIIIRNERVYTSSAAGNVYFNYEDLDRVKKGVEICSLRNDEEAQSLENDISALNEEIISSQKRKTDTSIFQPEIQKNNKKIKDYLDNSLSNFAKGNISYVYTVKDTISREINVRNQKMLDVDKNNVKELMSRKSIKESTLSQSISSIAAEESGILAYTVDGLEETLNFETMEALSKEQVKAKVDYSAIKSNKTVSAEDKVFKIVESNEWYIAAYIPNKLMDGFEEGGTKNIYVKNSEAFVPMPAEVFKIDRGETDSYVLFKFTKDMLNFMDRRSLTIKVKEGVHTGMKIPIGAIYERTLLKIPTKFLYGDESVVKKGAQENEKVSVKIIDKSMEDEGYVYVLQNVNTLKAADIIISAGEAPEEYTLSEIKTVKGVFKTNRGFAEFVEIKYEGELAESNGYVILEQELNTKLNVYDRIVSDTTTIEEGQRVN